MGIDTTGLGHRSTLRVERDASPLRGDASTSAAQPPPHRRGAAM